MAGTAFNSKQFNNCAARQFYINYADTTTTTGSYYQADKMFMGFFQNAQAVSDVGAWNTWVSASAGPVSGTLPSYQDTYYPQFFNTDTALWRNKMLYIVPCTRVEMVRKDSAGTIEYNGQKWSVVGTYDEETTTTGTEPRYCYYECDLKFYDLSLAVSAGVTSKNLLTGLALYKTELDPTLATADSESADWTGWVADIEYDATADYVYKTHATINSDSSSTQYDPTILRTAQLTYMYQNTFPAITRTATLLTKFSVIIEF